MTQSFTEFYLVNDNLVYPKICYENDISNSCMFNSSKNLNVTTMKPLIDPFSKECRIPLPSWIQSSHIYNNSSSILFTSIFLVCHYLTRTIFNLREAWHSTLSSPLSPMSSSSLDCPWLTPTSHVLNHTQVYGGF